MMISLCAIVKNEEDYISGFIEHHINMVDNLYILDTGSSDNTLSIITAYPSVNVFLYKEEDFSFANARNFILKKATGDWVIFLDADEKLSLNRIADLKCYLSNCNCDALCLWRYDYTPNGVWAGLFVARIMRKNVIKFVGDVFEYLESKDKKSLNMQLTTEMYIHHIGRLRDDKINMQKTKAYLAKVQNVMNVSDSDDVQGYYEILTAMLNQELCDTETAFKLLNKSMERSSFCTWYRYKSAADIYRMSGDNDKAYQLYNKSLNMTENSYEKAVSYEMMGVCLMNKCEYENAILLFQQSLELDKNLIHRKLYIALSEITLSNNNKSSCTIKEILKKNPYFGRRTIRANEKLRFRYDTPEIYTNLLI